MLKIKRDINQQDLKIGDLRFVQIWIIFTHLKLWIASAGYNFKWMKITINNFALKGLICFISRYWELNVRLNIKICKCLMFKHFQIVLPNVLIKNKNENIRGTGG